MERIRGEENWDVKLIKGSLGKNLLRSLCEEIDFENKIRKLDVIIRLSLSEIMFANLLKYIKYSTFTF